MSTHAGAPYVPLSDLLWASQQNGDPKGLVLVGNAFLPLLGAKNSMTWTGLLAEYLAAYQNTPNPLAPEPLQASLEQAMPMLEAIKDYLQSNVSIPLFEQWLMPTGIGLAQQYEPALIIPLRARIDRGSQAAQLKLAKAARREGRYPEALYHLRQAGATVNHAEETLDFWGTLADICLDLLWLDAAAEAIDHSERLLAMGGAPNDWHWYRLLDRKARHASRTGRFAVTQDRLVRKQKLDQGLGLDDERERIIHLYLSAWLPEEQGELLQTIGASLPNMHERNRHFACRALAALAWRKQNPVLLSMLEPFCDMSSLSYGDAGPLAQAIHFICCLGSAKPSRA